MEQLCAIAVEARLGLAYWQIEIDQLKLPYQGQVIQGQVMNFTFSFLLIGRNGSLRQCEIPHIILLQFSRCV